MPVFFAGRSPSPGMDKTDMICYNRRKETRGGAMNDIIFAGKHFLTYNVSRHKHSSWELVYCTGKSGEFVFEDFSLPYGVGDIVVIPPDVPHKNISEGGFTNIHLNIVETTLAFRQPVLIRDDVNHSLLHLFSNAYFLFSGDPERRAALIGAYGNLIVRSLTLNQAVDPKNQVTEEIEQSIVQNYADINYELDAVLHGYPYSYDYLCKIFRKEVGMTPHKYLTSLRLQAAADMLCSDYNNGRITEIAHLCGFRDSLYFSRLFKKRYQVSPKEYYQQKREEEENPNADSDSQKIILPE